MIRTVTIFSPKTIRWTALGLIVAYAAIFIILSVLILYAFVQIAAQGGGFVPRFETIQRKRLIATLAPFLSLSVIFVIAFVLYRKAKYTLSILICPLLLVVTIVAGQTYNYYNPDPIQYNFGPLDRPASGFLVLAPNSLPTDFSEKRHHYSRNHYTIDLVRDTKHGREFLHISESVTAQFGEPNLKFLAVEFTYQGELGRVYAQTAREDEERITYSLFWYNGPKQRLYIYFVAPKRSGYMPDEVIRILKSMVVQ